MGSPPVASCSRNFTLHLRAPRTRRLTTRPHRPVASGKEISLVTHAGFCRFPALCKWFSCLLRDTYKKVRGATVCTSSKSSEKHLLTRNPQLVAKSDSMKRLVLCLFAVCCWWLADASDRTKQRRKLEEVRKELGHVRKMLKVGSLTRSPLALCAAAVLADSSPLCPPRTVKRCSARRRRTSR